MLNQNQGDLTLQWYSRNLSLQICCWRVSIICQAAKSISSGKPGGRRLTDETIILDLIETIYLCGSGVADWQTFLDQFAHLFPALKLGLTGYDNLFSSIEVFCASNFDPQFVESFKEHYYKINPWQSVVLNSPTAPEVVWAHDSVPISEIEKTEFYVDWVKPQDNVVTGFSTMVIKERDRIFSLCANVNPKYLQEAQSAARTVALIGPHLRRAFELHRQLQGARILESSYQSLLDKLLAAVFLVDAAGKIKFANTKGERLLTQGRVVTGDAAGRLCFVDPRDHRGMTERIHRTSTRRISNGRDVFPLHVVSKNRYLAFVTTLSMQPASPVRCGSMLLTPDPSIAVFVIDSRELPKAKSDIIATALNVTPAEARLALALLHDQPLKKYADESGISFHTARTHMRSLLEKTGTHRQTELVRLLTNFFGALELG